MRKYIRGIDHVVILVRDLDRARDTYERLGFTLTPRGHHTLGSKNHCIVFGSDYLELLAVPKPHPAMQYFTDFLAGGEGLGAVAFRLPTTANAAHRELAAAGVGAESPLDFSRPVALADGTRDAEFRIVQLSPADTPGCRTFLCQHFNADLVWREEYQTHALGAFGIGGLGVVVEDPKAAAAGYARLLDAKPRRVLRRTARRDRIRADRTRLSQERRRAARQRPIADACTPGGCRAIHPRSPIAAVPRTRSRAAASRRLPSRTVRSPLAPTRHTGSHSSSASESLLPRALSMGNDFGILSYGAYLPRLRLQRKAIAAANTWFAPGLRGLAKGERANGRLGRGRDHDGARGGTRLSRGQGTLGGGQLMLASTTHPL
jgi:catechol 2,3-dioxygenase-like lactoylglutathione lyase family enzyme